MTKSQFVDRVAETSGLSKKDATTAVDAVIRSIEDALKSGEDVTFTGFGKFHVAERGAREGGAGPCRPPPSAIPTSPSAAPARPATRVPARRCRSPPAACPASPRAP